MAKQSYFFLFLSLVSLCSSTTTHHDVINPPTVFPTNPTTTPPATTFPPVTITPTNPATTGPLNPPVVTVPATLTPPVTNPVTQYPPTQPTGTVPVPVIPPPAVVSNSPSVPVIPPPAVVSNSPSVPGQSWCVAKPGASQTSIQLALDYACGLGGADCSQIQQGGNCYSPISLQSHASFAFNSYYQKNPSPQSCDFGGAASVVSTNPSSGSCVYQTGSSTSAGTTTPTPSTQTVNQPPVTSTPTIPTGGGIIGVGTPPAVFNPANPSSNTLTNPTSGGSAVYGFDGSPNGNNPTPSVSTHLQIHFVHTMVAHLEYRYKKKLEYSPDQFSFDSPPAPERYSLYCINQKICLSRIVTRKSHFLASALVTRSDDFIPKSVRCLDSDLIYNAHKVFDEIPNLNIISATAVIGRFVKQNRHLEAIDAFKRLLLLGIRPNEFTFGTVIGSSTSSKDVKLGKQLHGYALKMGLASNVFVGSAVLNCYVKLSTLIDARRSFGDTRDPNVVSMTNLISGYFKKHEFEEALSLFRAMSERSVVTWNAVIGGFSQTGRNEEAVSTFVDMLKEGSAVYGFDGSPNGNNPTPSGSTHLQIHFGHTMVVTLILHALLFH
ncbi:unnamed protein product [Thlaspi arvense]|uniref:X8 domain-containing protein n=1 Tax=Thlaspi arvense TaxID=13288 RepID=A0AAU9RDC6_THLAR|nr:unnamed protein product [Thlaspi arvense]